MKISTSKLLLVALGGSFLISCSKEEVSTEPVVRPVKAMKVGDTSSIDKAVFTGKAKATQEVNIAFEVSGRIISLPVDVGDVVEEDQELAILDPRDLRNAVAVAEAEKERSEALLGRIKKAFASNAVAAQDLTNAEAMARASDAALNIAKKRLSDATIRAPFKGRIAAKYVDDFENVIMKQKILRLLDNSKIEMVVNVPERLIPNVPFVESIKVSFSPFPDLEPLSATIKEVGSEASDLTRTYPVTLIMEQPEGVEILPGMAGEAIATANLPPERLAAGMAILPSAVFSSSSGDESFVWIVDEATGTVSKAGVTIERISPVGVVVTEGLTPGQWVVTAGVNSLTEGQKVRIMDQE